MLSDTTSKHTVGKSVGSFIMKKEYSISKDKLVNLEEGDTRSYVEGRKNIPPVNNGCKQLIRIASILCYIQLVLFVGWGCYTIWDNFRVRPLEAKVTDVVMPESRELYAQAEENARKEIERDDILRNLKNVLDKDLDLLQEILQVDRAKIPSTNTNETKTDTMTNVSESNKSDQGIKIWKDQSDESKSHESWYSSESQGTTEDEVSSSAVPNEEKKSVIEWSLLPFLLPFGVPESSEQITSEENNESEASIKSIERPVEKSETTFQDENRSFSKSSQESSLPQTDDISSKPDESSATLENHQQFESNQEIYQEYRKYKCTDEKCEIVEPSDKSTEEKETSDIGMESSIFVPEDYTEEYEDLYDDWLRMSELEFPINRHMHDQDDTNKESLESSFNTDEDLSQKDDHNEENSSNHLETIILPELKFTPTNQEELVESVKDTNDSPSDETLEDFRLFLQFKGFHSSLPFIESPHPSLSHSQSEEWKDGRPERSVSSDQVSDYSRELRNSFKPVAAEYFERKDAYNFEKKLEMLSGHIDRLHARYLRANELNDDYISQEFPSDSLDR